MTYVTIRTTNGSTSYKFNDGAIFGIGNDVQHTSKDWDEWINYHLASIYRDGNYYTGGGNGIWNKARRNYVCRQWVNLRKMIHEQLDDFGEINICIPNYFTLGKESTAESVVDALMNLAADIRMGTIDNEEIIKISEALGL